MSDKIKCARCDLSLVLYRDHKQVESENKKLQAELEIYKEALELPNKVMPNWADKNGNPIRDLQPQDLDTILGFFEKWLYAVNLALKAGRKVRG